MRFIKNVAFFGYSDTKPGERLYKEAFEVAKLLAKNGFVIVNGGGPGVMDASTKGAEAAGGETIAITFFPQKAPGFEGIYPKNVTDRQIKTGNYIERMFKLLAHGDTYIIFKGGTGTLSEFATAWCLARLYFGFHKPFILYGNFWQKIIAAFKKYMFMRGTEDKIFKIVQTPQQVLQTLAAFEKEFDERFKKFLGPEGERAFMEGGRIFEPPLYFAGPPAGGPQKTDGQPVETPLFHRRGGRHTVGLPRQEKR